LLGLAALGLLLHGYRAGRFGRGALLWIPPIMLAWDCLHGALYGLVFIGTFTAGETLKVMLGARFGGWQEGYLMPRDKLVWLGICVGIAAVLMVASPYGPRSYDIFVGFLEEGGMAAVIQEFKWTPLQLEYVPFWSSIALVAASFVAAYRRLDFTHIVLALVFVFLGVRYARATAVFCLVALPLATSNLEIVTRRRRGEWQAARWPAVAGAAAVMSVLGATCYHKLLTPEHHYSLGVGIDESFYPIGAVRFIKETGPRGRMYNSDTVGGYLAFHLGPDRKIFHYNHHMLFERLSEQIMEHGFLQKWDFDFGVLGHKLERDFVFRRDQWATVYWEPAATVVAKLGGKNDDIVRRNRFRYFLPGIGPEEISRLSSDSRVYPDLVREMARSLEHRHDVRVANTLARLIASPTLALPAQERIELLVRARRWNEDNLRLLGALGVAHYSARDYQAARTALKRALASGGQGDLRLTLGYVEYDSGRFAAAASEFRQFLRERPDHAAAQYGLGLACYRMKDRDGAIRAWSQYLRIQPNGKWAEKAREYMQELR
jgi:Flp pilus assembly protein TadD